MDAEILQRLGFVSIAEIAGADVARDAGIYIRRRTPGGHEIPADPLPEGGVQKSEPSSYDSNFIIGAGLRSILAEKGGDRSCNVFASGYRRRDAAPGQAEITCEYPNPVHLLLKSEKWMKIHASLGESAMVRLVKHYDIVERMGGKFVLVSGEVNKLGRGLRELRRGGGRVIRDLRAEEGPLPLAMQCTVSRLFYGGGRVPKEKATAESAHLRERAARTIERMQSINVQAVIDRFLWEKLPRSGAEESFSDCEVGDLHVLSILMAISRRVFSGVFDPYNFAVLKEKLGIFLRRARYEKLPVERMTSGFRWKDWRLYKSPHCNKAEFIKRQRIMVSVVRFLFETYYPALVWRNFYVTQRDDLTQRFFLKKKFMPKYRLCMERHLRERFEEVAGLGGRSAAVPQITLVPKERGFRAIVDLSKDEGARGGKFSVNRLSRGILSVLKREAKERRAWELGESQRPWAPRLKLNNSLLSAADAFKRLKEFKAKHEEEFREKKTLFILKLDVKNCFDSVPHEKLRTEGIYSRLFDKKEYKIYKYANMCADGILSMHWRTVYPGESLSHKKLLSYGSRGDVVRSLEKCSCMRRGAMEECVRAAIEGHIVGYNGKLYRQRTGLPQGYSVSPLICSYYFGAMDEILFNKHLRRGAVLRFMDDFLVLSWDMREIASLLGAVEGKAGEYGIEINRSKSLFVHNNPLEGNRQKDPQREDGTCALVGRPIYKKHVRWCGFLMDTETLSCKAECNLREMRRKVQSMPNDLQTIRRSMKSYASRKLQKALLEKGNEHRKRNAYALAKMVLTRMRCVVDKAGCWGKKRKEAEKYVEASVKTLLMERGGFRRGSVRRVWRALAQDSI